MIAVSAFLLAAAICATSCAPWPQGRSDFNPARDSLPRDEPQPVYGPDRADPWNQVFYLLFTRTLRARLAADGAELFAAGDDRLTLSPRTVTRIESGDRAIDPLYPSWLWMGSSEFDISPSGSWGILSDPRAAELEAALHRVRQTARAKPPLARALMQHDLWAAYDMLSAPRSFAWPRGLPSDAAAATRRKRNALVALVAASMKSLALTRAEIASLPATYAAAAARHGLPDLLSAAGRMDGSTLVAASVSR